MAYNVIIDTDPGMGIPWAAVDDNFASLFCLSHPDITIEMISIVAGNVEADKGFCSIQDTLKKVNREIPTYIGSTKPLLRNFKSGHQIGREKAAALKKESVIETSIETKPLASLGNPVLCAYSDVLEKSTSPVTIFALGPLTNIALLLHQRPDLYQKIDSIIIMGGALQKPGNVTPFAEFNIWIDPEAAEMVFHAPVPKVLVPLDLTMKVKLFESDFIRELAGYHSELSNYLINGVKAWMRAQEILNGVNAFVPHDCITVGYRVAENLFQTEKWNVTIDTKTGATLGKKDPTSTTKICTSVDIDGFKKLFFKYLHNLCMEFPSTENQ